MATRRDNTVLCLGAGNDPCSRFAAVLFNSVASKLGLPWQASSRELNPECNVPDDGPTAGAAVAALTALGVRGAEAVTRPAPQVTADDFQQAALIVALTQAEHRPLLQERFPAWADKVEFWTTDDAPDTLALIERAVMNLVARLCGGGGRPETPAREAPSPARQPVPEPPRKALTAKVGRETAGRRGKGVTTVFDVSVDESALRELATTLKQRCGTGGTVKDGRIEIQGDQRERIVAELEKLGFKVKRVGG